MGLHDEGACLSVKLVAIRKRSANLYIAPDPRGLMLHQISGSGFDCGFVIMKDIFGTLSRRLLLVIKHLSRFEVAEKQKRVSCLSLRIVQDKTYVWCEEQILFI